MSTKRKNYGVTGERGSPEHLVGRLLDHERAVRLVGGADVLVGGGRVRACTK